MKIVNIKCDNQTNPLGIDNIAPVFSWQLISEFQNTVQLSYRLTVFCGDKVVWEHTEVTNRTFGVKYAGISLKSKTQYHYIVEITDNHGNSTVSGEQFFETAYLDNSEWAAEFIEPDQLEYIDRDFNEECYAAFMRSVGDVMSGKETEIVDVDNYMLTSPNQPYHPPVRFRRSFFLEKKVAMARLYITAHGIYDVKINGNEVSDRYFAPENTDYAKLLKYQTYDVTDYLKSDINAIGITVADGWYKGKLALGRGDDYGHNPALFLELNITFNDGTTDCIVSDSSFLFSHDGHIRYADLFTGEKHDANFDDADFSLPEYNPVDWKQTHIAKHDKTRLFAQNQLPVVSLEPIPAKKIFTAPNGDTLIDFGQNIAGVIRAELSGNKGDEFTFEHGEVLDKDGNFFYPFTDTTRAQKDIFVLKGEGKEVFGPKFTYHGFRYVRVRGNCSILNTEQFSAIPLTSNNAVTGSFSCSDDRLNKLQQNALWSQLGNNIAIPTDCPTREKAGWTGDVFIYAKTAILNQDMQAFYNEWLRSVRKEQSEKGIIWNCTPVIKSYAHMRESGSTGWGDVIVGLPFELYKAYGDENAIRDNYDAMKKWLKYLEALAHDMPEGANEFDERKKSNQSYLLNTGFHFGDWLVPSVKNEQGFSDGPMSSYLTMNIIATALYADSCKMLSRAALIVGNQDDADYFIALYKRICEAFIEEFVSEDGKLSQEMQGNYIIALKTGVCGEKYRQRLVDYLVDLIKNNDYCLNAGFITIPHILDVLCENGYKDIAYKLLFQTKSPSWLYEVEKGATTIWEQWDAIKENGDVCGCSFNHYAFGCVSSFFYEHILGIRNDGIAYKKINISPDYDCGLKFAKGYYDSVHGRITVEWDQEEIRVEIPCNCTAVICLPDGSSITMGSGKYIKNIGNNRRE